MPAVYERRTGTQLYYRSAPRDWGTRWGGSWCQFVEDYLVTWNTHFKRSSTSPIALCVKNAYYVRGSAGGCPRIK